MQHLHGKKKTTVASLPEEETRQSPRSQAEQVELPRPTGSVYALSAGHYPKVEAGSADASLRPALIQYAGRTKNMLLHRNGDLLRHAQACSGPSR